MTEISPELWARAQAAQRASDAAKGAPQQTAHNGFSDHLKRLTAKYAAMQAHLTTAERDDMQHKACAKAALEAADRYPLMTGSESMKHGVIDPVYQCVSIIMEHFPHADRGSVQRAVEARYAAFGASAPDEKSHRGKPVKGSSDGFGLGTP